MKIHQIKVDRDSSCNVINLPKLGPRHGRFIPLIQTKEKRSTSHGSNTNNGKPWSSLFYNMSARHERHECDTNDTSATRVRHEQNEYDTSETRVLHQRHECDTSAKKTIRVRQEWEVLILITTRVKTYFHTPILAIWKMKDYKERNNFVLRTTFWKCLAPMPKCIWKVHRKNWTL